MRPFSKSKRKFRLKRSPSHEKREPHRFGASRHLQKIGKELTVDALLTGRVVQHGDTIQVSADLTDVRDNTEIWGGHYQLKTSDILSVQERIASDIADKLRSRLSGAEKQQVTKQGTQNPEAYQLYVKGRYYWNKRTNADLKTAISYFNQAIDRDPSYALAYSGLADAYGVLPGHGIDPNDVSPSRMQRPMIFGVRHLVSYLSRFMSLQPGNIISTGTPPGVGMRQKPPLYLQPGNRMRLGIEGLGEQNQTVIAESA